MTMSRFASKESTKGDSEHIRGLLNAMGAFDTAGLRHCRDIAWMLDGVCGVIEDTVDQRNNSTVMVEQVAPHEHSAVQSTTGSASSSTRRPTAKLCRLCSGGSQTHVFTFWTALPLIDTNEDAVSISSYELHLDHEDEQKAECEDGTRGGTTSGGHGQPCSALSPASHESQPATIGTGGDDCAIGVGASSQIAAREKQGEIGTH